jgi:hypothetical protein
MLMLDGFQVLSRVCAHHQTPQKDSRHPKLRCRPELGFRPFQIPLCIQFIIVLLSETGCKHPPRTSMNKQPAEEALPRRGLLLGLTIIGIALSAFGLLITGDFGRPWAGSWYFPGVGYALLDVGLGALLVFGFVEKLLSRERKLAYERDTARWNAVKDKVMKLISAELNGIATEIINATNPLQGGFSDPDATNEQILEQTRNTILKQLEVMAEDDTLLRTRVAQASPNILDRPHGDLYAQRAQKVGTLQARYWSPFLEPKMVSYLIDIEQALENLDIHTRITHGERQRPTGEGTLEEALTGWYDQAVYRDLQTLLRLIIQGAHENLIVIL